MDQKYGFLRITFSNGSSTKFTIPEEKYQEIRNALLCASETGATVWTWLTDENGEERLLQSQYIAMLSYEPLDG